MIDEAACNWAARLDRGLTDEEAGAFSSWMAADGRHAGALLRAQAAMSLLDRGRALGGADESDAAEAPAPVTRRGMLRLGGGLAAALAGGLAWRLWPLGRRIATDIGEIRRLPLDDGSLAVVNSGTRLRVAFSETRRDIELASGEAWFQVARNRARPFTVSAGPAHVQAVGTAFDVRRHDGLCEVTVTEGTVKLWSTALNGDPAFVKAGHRALIGEEGIQIASLSPAVSDRQLAWREGRIVLDNMSIGAAAAEFNRYHTQQLVVDPALADRQVVGWFSTDDLDGFAQASAAMVDGRVVREGQVVRITTQ
jgi:transmembrane sensor